MADSFLGEHGEYRLSKKQIPILYSKLLYKMGPYFLDIQYMEPSPAQEHGSL